MTRRMRRGFSLVELLIVVFIIAVLAAIVASSVDSVNCSSFSTDIAALIKKCRTALERFRSTGDPQAVNACIDDVKALAKKGKEKKWWDDHKASIEDKWATFKREYDAARAAPDSGLPEIPDKLC
ncbi:MAG: type II secretion system protein [Planctomycetota bacterium]